MASKMSDKYDKALKLSSASTPDYEAAYKLLVMASEDGDDRATYALGTWYLFGRFVRKNLCEAVKFLKAASEAGNAAATYDLAVCYEEGKGVKENHTLAFRLYVKAALWGDKQSVAEVGRMHYYGIGTERNRKLANVWLDRADELGVE